MFKLLFGDNFSDDTLVVTNFYKIFPVDVSADQHRETKVKSLIEQMGDKYLLATHIKRKDAI